MEFTNRELELLSEGIIQLISNAERAYCMVSDVELKKYIRIYRKNLQDINTKICNYMEG